MLSLNGHPTWAKLPKEKGPLTVLLHGGMSSSASLLHSIGPGLRRHFAIAAFDRRGHGRTADTEAPFHYEDMADETVAFLEHLGRRAHLVGHSDGGNVALLVARKRPDLVKRLVVVGANFHHDGLLALPEMVEESPEFATWAHKYAQHSPDGLAHASVVFRKALTLFRTEPTLTEADLHAIVTPTLVMVGDDDVASLTHTAALFEALPDAQLSVLPGTSHAVLKERTKESVRIISHFLRASLPPVTYAPVRRLVVREDPLSQVLG